MLLDLFKRQIQRSDIPIMTRKNTKATSQAKGAPHAKAFQSRTLEDETPPHKAPDSNPHYQHPQLPERKASGIHSSKAWVLNYHGDRLRACAAPVPGFWHCSVKLAQTPKSQGNHGKGGMLNLYLIVQAFKGRRPLFARLYAEKLSAGSCRLKAPLACSKTGSRRPACEGVK